MKNLNKVLAMVVVFAMMITTVAFASSFTDVADSSSYSTAIEVGVDLGIIKGYTDGTFAPEGEITRAEFAAIIVRLLGQEAQAEGAKASTQFIDVPADHWAAGYINIATQAKVINGYGDGNFGPEDLVEYQDAITMMVRALGYEPAIGTAGYPTGYLTKAGELGLTTNVNGTNGVAINRGTVAQIAFNALDVALMTQSGYGTFTQYVINDGYSATTGQTNVKKTLLSENHSIVRVQGIIKDSTDSSSSAVTGTDKVTVNVTNYMYNKFGIGNSYRTVKIDTDNDGTPDTDVQVVVDESMEVGASKALDYVGKKCIIFVKYDEFNDKCTVASIYEVKSSDSMTLDLADIETMDLLANIGSAEATIEYKTTGTKTAEVSVDAYADVYYNGVEISSVVSGLPASDAALIAKSGSIELALLDSTNTISDYDTVYITAYDVVVVKEVREAAERLIAKTASISALNRIDYSEEDGDVKATLVDADGAAMDWADLTENDVLIVKYVQAGKKLYEAQLASNTVTGTVTEVDATSDWGTASTTAYKYVVIDGTEYKVLACAEADKNIKVGDEGTYYITDSGIVWHEATVASNDNFAYVINFQAATAMDPAKVKLLTKENGIVTFELASKIYVSAYNQNNNNEYERSTAKIATTTAGLIPNNTLITYKVDASNQITAIEKAYNVSDANNNGDDVENYFTMDDTFGTNGVGLLSGYDAEDASFGRYNLTSDTVVFYVATQEDKDDWEVVALKNLADDDKLGGVSLYNVDDDDNIGAIVVTDKNTTVISGSTNAATFVTAVSEGYDEDGVLVNFIKGYVGGEEVTYVSDASASVGTLVIPEYKANGDVKQFAVVNGSYTKGQVGASNYAKGYAGAAVSQDSSKGRVVLSISGTDTMFKVPANANVYVMNNTATGRVKYTTDAYIGYVEFDEGDDSTIGTLDDYWYINSNDAFTNITVTIYEYDSDIVDVLFTING